MCVELIEKVHEQVYFERAHTQYDVFLRLRSVATVIPSRLLSLHPQVDQLLKLTQETLRATESHRGSLNPKVFSHLQREHHESYADHNDYEQLGRPYARSHVSEAHGGEGDDAKVEGIEESEVLSRSFQMLDSTCAVFIKNNE